MKNLRKCLLTVIFSLAVCLVVPFAFQVNVQAAKNITANANYKKAPLMKSKGTYNVTAKKNNSYVRFQAPSAGKWTITITNIRDYKKSSAASLNLGNWYPSRLKKLGNSWYLAGETVTTNGGKARCLWTATQGSYDRYYKNKKGIKLVDKYLATRKCVVNLQKGENMYFQYYYTGGDKCQYTIGIKK